MRRDNRPSLIRILQITDSIMNHTRTTRIDQRLHPGLLTRLNHTRRPIHIDLLIQLLRCAHKIRRCSMDHDIWLRFFENGYEGGDRGDIAVVVGNTIGIGTAIAGRREVEDGDFAGVGVVEEVHDVMAQEPATANYEDVA